MVSGDIEMSPPGVGGWAISDSFRISPPGGDAAVAVVFFGATVVNVAAQDEISISELPVAGFRREFWAGFLRTRSKSATTAASKQWIV